MERIDLYRLNAYDLLQVLASAAAGEQEDCDGDAAGRGISEATVEGDQLCVRLVVSADALNAAAQGHILGGQEGHVEEELNYWQNAFVQGSGDVNVIVPAKPAPVYFNGVPIGAMQMDCIKK